jgi:hypothetical protein
MGVSYEGFEEEASDLFATIESRHKGKGVAGMSSSPKKVSGNMVKGVRELLNLSSSVNYDSRGILINPALLLVIVARLLSHYESENSQLECSRS